MHENGDAESRPKWLTSVQNYVETARPYYPFGIVGLIVLSEAMAAALLFPFVYFMIRDFGVEDEKLIGRRAGLVASSFFFAQFLSGWLWGRISDKIGRRAILLMGLLGNAVFLILFGASQTYWQALLFRSLCGLLNGNVAAARTVVGELAEKLDVPQGKAFSLFGFCNSLGYLVGPLLGGFLSSPGSELRFPYLLPCVVAGGFSFVVFLVTLVYLRDPGEAHDLGKAAADTTPLLSSSNPSGSRFTARVYGCIFGVTCLCLHSTMFDEVFPLFSAGSYEDGFGLSLRPADIATTLAAMSAVIFSVQLIVYPFLSSRFKHRHLWRSTAVGFIIVYPLFSLLPQLSSPRPVRMGVAVVLLAARFSLQVVSFTTINVLTNISVQPQHRGSVNGIAQSAASLSRAIGPSISGFLWSWSLTNGLPVPLDHHFLFILLGIIALLQLAGSPLILDK